MAARSANEISALTLKAGRGAGLALGLAEDLARAAPHLARDGRLDLLLALLEPPFTPPQLDAGVLTGGHALLRATALLDLRAAGQEVIADPGVPPQVLESLEASRGGADKAALTGPYEVEGRLWSALTQLAARTYVPESDASRNSGAGADS